MKVINPETSFLGRYSRLNSWQSFLSFANTLPNPDTILSAKNETVAMYRPLIADSQVGAAVQARELALKSYEWEFTVDSNDRADLYALDLVRDNFNSENINMAVLHQEMMEAVWLGYSPIETILMNDGKNIYYDKLIGQSSEHFAFDQENRLVFLSQNRPLDGEPVITSGPEKAVELVAYRATHRNPYGQAQLAGCFWPAHFIKGDMKLWLSYIDRLGDTPVIIKTASTDKAYRNLLLTVIDDLKSSGGGVLGTNDTVEFLAADKVATSTLFRDFRSINEAAISKQILGHASALDATPGKLGNDNTALVVRGDITESDKKFIEFHMNNLVRWLAYRNTTPKNCPYFRFIQVEDERENRAKRDVTLTSLGVQFTEDYVGRTYNLKPTDDFRIVEKPQMDPYTALFPSTVQAQEVKKKAVSQPVELAEEEDVRPVDRLISKVEKTFIREFKEYINAIDMAVQNAEDFEQAISDVIRADNRTQVNSEYLERALLTARALGMAEVYDQLPDVAKDALFAEETSGDVDHVFTNSQANKFMSKRLAVTEDEFKNLSQFEREFAFTISGATQLKTSQDVLAKLTEAFRNGYTYQTFKKNLGVTDIAGNNLKLAFRQNMNTAYMVGRYNQMKSVAEYLPYWEYYTVGDDRVREEHAALHGEIRRHDDPFWNIWYPPNGYNCRCGVRALTQEQVDAMGIEPGAGIPDYEELVQKGKITDVNLSGAHQAKDKFLPAEGFRHNAAKVRTEWLDMLKKENLAKSTPVTEMVISSNTWERQGLKKFSAMGYKTEADLKRYTKESIAEKLEKSLPEKFLDKFGKNVFIDKKDFIRHIQKDTTRFSFAPHIKDILTNPDEVWTHLQVEGKHVILVRNYLKRINSDNIQLVVKSKNGISTITTLIVKGNIDNVRVGTLLK